MQALQGMEDKHHIQKELEEAKLELSRKRDEREQEEREEKRAEASGKRFTRTARPRHKNGSL
jgi:hypothetical protein